jgi:single-strand DNA-binding protein
VANLNKVLLMGNLTRDPDLRYTGSGQAICNFGIAVNREWSGKDGQKGKDTCFLRVKVWGRQGENCAQYLKKGRPCFVEGRLESSQWETKEGEKRTTIEVVAERVQFLGGRGEGGRGGGSDYSRSSDNDQDSQNDFIEDVEDDIPF